MNMAATIISARVRGYLTRRAYLGAADHESEAEHARLDARLAALLDRLADVRQWNERVASAQQRRPPEGSRDGVLPTTPGPIFGPLGIF